MREQARSSMSKGNEKDVHFSEAQEEESQQSDDSEDNMMLVSINHEQGSVLLTADSEKEFWVLDSGATDHCSAHFSDFDPSSYQEITPINLSDVCCEAVGRGNIKAKITSTEGKTITVTITDVLYVPDLAKRTNLTSCRLLSMSKMQHNTKSVLYFSNDEAHIQLGKTRIPIIRPENQNLYYVYSTVLKKDKREDTKGKDKAKENNIILTTVGKQASLWHERLGHFGKKCITKTEELTDLKLPPIDDAPFCNACAQHNQIFRYLA